MPLFQPNVKKLKEQHNVKELIKALQDDRVCSDAVVALGEIGDILAVEPLRGVLRAALKEDEKYTITYAAVSLAQLGDAQGIETLLAILLGDVKGACTPSKAIEAMGRGGSPAIPYLIKALKIENIYLRAQVVANLVDFGDPRAAEPLILCLNFSSDTTIGNMRAVTDNVRAALLKIGDPATASLSRVLMDGDKRWSSLKNECLSALGAFGDKAVGPLVDFISDRENDKDLVSTACYLLGEIGDARAIEPLLLALEHPEKRVRSTALKALQANGWKKTADKKPALARLPALIPEIEFISLSAWSQGAGPGESEFESGLSCWNAGDTACAQRAYKKALKTGLTRLYEAAARMNLGKIYFQQRDIAAAVNEFHKVIRLSPQRASTAYDSATYLALIYQALGMKDDMQAAIELASKAMQHVDYQISAQAANEIQAAVREVYGSR